MKLLSRKPDDSTTCDMELLWPNTMRPVPGAYDHPERLLRRIQARVARQAGRANTPNLAAIDRVLTALDMEGQ